MMSILCPMEGGKCYMPSCFSVMALVGNDSSAVKKKTILNVSVVPIADTIT